MDKARPIGQNGIQNKNVKHKLDELYKIWLGKGELFQTFSKQAASSAKQVEELLNEGRVTAIDENNPILDGKRCIDK